MRGQALLVTATGIDVRHMTPMDVFLCATKILHDEPLNETVRMHAGSILQKGTRIQILRSWPEIERQKLRERITGVIPIGKS